MTLASIQYDLTVVGGALTVKQAPLTLTTSDVVKTYDGTTLAAASIIATGGTQLFGTDSLSSGTVAFADKNAGTDKTVTVGAVTVSDGNGGNNYTVTYVDNTTSTITPKLVTVSGITANNKPYDGTATATVNTNGATLTGEVSGDSLGVSAIGTFMNTPKRVTEAPPILALIVLDKGIKLPDGVQ